MQIKIKSKELGTHGTLQLVHWYDAHTNKVKLDCGHEIDLDRRALYETGKGVRLTHEKVIEQIATGDIVRIECYVDQCCTRPVPIRIHDQVAEFMKRAKQAMPQRPIQPDDQVIGLRQSLIDEEVQEYRYAVEKFQALAASETPVTEQDFYAAWAEIADAIADINYVVAGTGIAWGLPMIAVQEAVHKANMRKFGTGSYCREDGKHMKPPDWKAPDIVRIIHLNV